MAEQKKFLLKIVNDRLVIDMNKMTDDYSEAFGYDGLPSKYDIGELANAEVFTTIELDDGAVEQIMAEYKGGGECGWCNDIVKELRTPHQFDFADGKMCRRCWEFDREMYKGSMGVDIGPYEQEGEVG